MMQLIRNQDSKKISIVDDSGFLVLELYFIPSFFLWVLRTKKPIIIDQNIDEFFYHNLAWLMNNSYEFPHEYSKMSEDELIWFSEQCYDIENKEECDMVSRLIIRRINGEFHITYHNPFFLEHNIDRDGVISFSPAGNGFLSRNIETGLTLQDDIISVFYNTLHQKKIDDDKSYKMLRKGM